MKDKKREKAERAKKFLDNMLGEYEWYIGTEIFGDSISCALRVFSLEDSMQVANIVPNEFNGFLVMIHTYPYPRELFESLTGEKSKH